MLFYNVIHRLLTAIGEAAIIATSYPITSNQVDQRHLGIATVIKTDFWKDNVVLYANTFLSVGDIS